MSGKLIRLRESESTPALRDVASEILKRRYPIGTRVPFSIGKNRYMAVIEEHYHPVGGDRKPWGKHPGVSLFYESNEPGTNDIFNPQTPRNSNKEPANEKSREGGESKYHSVAKIPGLENKSPEFIQELINIGNRLDINPSYIASVMKAESGFNHQAVNPKGGATGLIQFMPRTAKDLGTTVDELKSMSDVEQLKYVEMFFKPYSGRIKSPGDLYMATFLPIFLGKPNDFVIGELGNNNVISGNLTYNLVYTYNKGFDRDKDGKITVGDVTGRAGNIYASGLRSGEVRPEEVGQNIQSPSSVATNADKETGVGPSISTEIEDIDPYLDNLLRSLYASSISRKYSRLKRAQVFVNENSDYESPLYQSPPISMNLHNTPLGGGFDDVNPYTYTGNGASYQGFPEDLDSKTDSEGEEDDFQDVESNYFSDDNVVKKLFF